MSRGPLIEVHSEIEPTDTPRIVIVSGPSGVGKGTIVSGLMDKITDIEPARQLSRSWTTRPQRANESPGDYVFSTREAFEEKIAMGFFLEHAEFRGNYYGTPLPTLDQQLIVEIEVKGARHIHRLAEKAGTLSAHQFIYVLSPDALDLVTRLFGRPDRLDRVDKVARFATFLEQELPMAKELGAHVVVNRRVEDAVNNIIASMNGVFFCDPELEEVVRNNETYGPKFLEVLRDMYFRKDSNTSV